MSGFYRDALEAEAFGHDARPLCKRNSNPHSNKTWIALEMAYLRITFEMTSFPLPFGGS